MVPKLYAEGYLAKFGGKMKDPNKVKEGGNVFRITFTKFCHVLMELLELMS
jgi:hypothetical protein